MKHKILLVLALTYLALVLVIFAIGLNVQKIDQPFVNQTDAFLSATVSVPDNNQTQVFRTSVDDVGAQNHTDRPKIDTETVVSPELEPTLTLKHTTSVQEPTPEAPTSTYPAYPIPDGTATATRTLIAYPVEESATPAPTTSTAAPSTTPNPETGWGGDWTVFWEQPDGSYLSGQITVEIMGSEVSALGLLGGDQVGFQGILNESRVTVVGSWAGSGDGGNFYWRSYSSDHFIGSLDREIGFCAIRRGENLPEPCKKIPSDL
jgi:hypothetical protein